MRNHINEMARAINVGLSIHDLRTVPGPTHTNVIFDCLRPESCPMDAHEISQRLGAAVVEAYPGSVPKITVDEDYVSARQ